jgi:CDP-diacylglycerol--glycerol-3-phosphate 3-phosphatidyltransferase
VTGGTHRSPGGLDAAPAPAPPGAAGRARAAILNVPNALTVLRLFLCFAFFGILIYCTTVLRLPVDGEGALSWTNLRSGEVKTAHAGLRDAGGSLTILLDVAFAIFCLAAATDTLDGQIARRYGLETDFGRIADPFVDKIMILGALTLLMPLTVHIAGWMVVLVLARELLVSGIRGFAESHGVAFPATFWGKTKMVSQAACVGACVMYIGHPESAVWKWIFIPLLWWTIATTVFSGAVYLRRAAEVLRRGSTGAGARP